MHRHQLDVQWNVADRQGLPGDELIAGWLSASLDYLGQSAAEVCVRIVDEAEIRILNKQYRGQDKPTNVLSFSNDSVDETGTAMLGDIIVCSCVVITEAKAQGKTVAAHFAHLVLHGLLHLQGHDHSVDHQATEMETIEIDLMANLGYENPYL